MAEDEVLDAREAAKYLKINEQTIRRLARDNEIPAFRVGGTWRFKKSSLNRWAESQELNRRSPHVLIVDDEEAIRVALQRLLELERFKVTTAGGGIAALEALQEEVPDVVLLDMKMPDMDGPTVLQEIRKGWGSLPVIILTGYPDSDLVSHALQFSPITLLAKPVTPAQVVATVRGLIGNQKVRST